MMRKPDNADPLQNDDPAFIAGRREWDSRIEEAAVRERRAFLFGAGGAVLGLAGLGYGVMERTRAIDPVLRYVEVCRDRLLAVVSQDTPGDLPAQLIAEKLKAWLRGARAVSLDGPHMRDAIWATYRMTEAGSPAEAVLKAHHARQRPDERAATEIVVLERQTAMPDGPPTSRTWRMEWREITTARDGRPISAEDWRMILTFTVRRPTTTEEIERNWSGIFVQTFHWERVTPGSPRIASSMGAPR